MDIFDSNIWVSGLTGQNSPSRGLIDDVIQGNQEVFVNAYIYQEVVDAFSRSKQGKKVNQLQTGFAQLVSHSQSITGPSQQDVRQMNTAKVRSQAEMNVIAETLGIQSKDAPILCLAYGLRSENPTIFTGDQPFSQFTPSQYNLPQISMQHIRI